MKNSGEGSANVSGVSSGKSEKTEKESGASRLLSWGVFFVICLAFQWHSGAWESDFGGHADEGSHVVTGLMLRDYLAGGFLEQWHPMRYAEAYYEQFPKVAIGHYPPGFYLIEGIFFLLWRSPGAALVLMVFLAAWVARITWVLAGDIRVSRVGSWAAGLAVCLLPLMRTYTAIVMSDLLLVAVVLLATRAFARFVQTQMAKDAWVFGLLAAAAILVKGSGLLLALVPPLTILLTGKWNLLRSWRLWVAPIPVICLALPWMLVTRHITAEGMNATPLGTYIPQAVAYYLAGIGKELGWLATGLLGIGLLEAGIRVIRKKHHPLKDVENYRDALIALILGGYSFYVAIPSGLDLRYLMPVLPAIVVLLISSVENLISRTKAARLVPWGGVLLVLIMMFEVWRPVEKKYTGGTEALNAILADATIGAEMINLLVVSDARGEGALTAGAAFQGKEIFHVFRGSKFLANSDWLGRDYKAKFETPEEFRGLLKINGIGFLVIDSPEENRREKARHWMETLALLASSESRDFAEEFATLVSERKHGRTGEFLVYRISFSRKDEIGR